MRPEELRFALGFDDLGLLPTDKSSISSRRNLSTKTKFSKSVQLEYPLISSPMDTVSDVETCIALNSIGAAGILHRFMPISMQRDKAKEIYKTSGRSYVAIGLKDYQERIQKLYPYTQVFVLDVANGSSIEVEKFLKWYRDIGYASDIIVGNTLTKSSVSKLINGGASGVRHGIGIGSVCLTSDMTGIQCPSVTALYYAWKAVRNYKLWKRDIDSEEDLVLPTILLDGGINKPADLVKAIVCGADAVISGRIFAGCKETPGEVVEGKKVYRGMASLEVLKEYELADLEDFSNLFIEGKKEEVDYTGKSVTEIVYEFTNGLRSAMSYLGFTSIEEMRGSLWEDRCVGIRLRS